MHRPLDGCARAQKLAAELYGAEVTHFLVNGSSVGNHAMMLATLFEGETVIMPRSAHRSSYGGLFLSGAEAVFCASTPELPMSTEQFEQALERTPGARALHLISPNYYGLCADLHGMVERAHQAGMPVLLDEAWGGHLRFHPELPACGISAGADLVVQSTHKLLGGLSQSGMLHLQGDRVDRHRLEKTLQVLQSTSPSMLLLASLDAARHQMAEAGFELWDQAIRMSRWARSELNALAGIRCWGKEVLDEPGVSDWDPTRLVIEAGARGYTGYQLERVLRQDFAIQVEFSDRFRVVCVVTPGHTQGEMERLLEAFAALPERPVPAPGSLTFPSALPERGLTFRQALSRPSESVERAAAVGRICAETITPYPPGIPLLCPGEVLSQGVLEYLSQELKAGAKIEGTECPGLERIRVVR